MIDVRTPDGRFRGVLLMGWPRHGARSLNFAIRLGPIVRFTLVLHTFFLCRRTRGSILWVEREGFMVETEEELRLLKCLHYFEPAHEDADPFFIDQMVWEHDRSDRL